MSEDYLLDEYPDGQAALMLSDWQVSTELSHYG